MNSMNLNVAFPLIIIARLINEILNDLAVVVTADVNNEYSVNYVAHSFPPTNGCNIFIICACNALGRY